ncbi:MAG: acyl-CoA/acyl-ACP dehydrogenase [Peptococcaceae bacterium]|nr:acyl-CoA/acyl-ACP dehydrogenase [Peptococcaceae bacterium]
MKEDTEHFSGRDNLELRSRARQFARENILPMAEELDRNPVYPMSLILKAVREGFGIVSREYGESGYSTGDQAIIVEEFAWVCAGITAALTVHEAAAIPIRLSGSPEQQREIFAKMAEGKLFTMAFTEPHCGSDITAIKTLASYRDGEYYLSGCKSLVSNIDVSDYFLVYAKIEGENDRDLYPFVVSRQANNLTVSEPEAKLGQKACAIGRLELDGVGVKESMRLGAHHHGIDSVRRIFSITRTWVAALSIGVARRALEISSAYAGERTAFGVPIWKNQAVGHVIADMAVALEAAKLLTYEAAYTVDKGCDTGIMSSYAKLFASEAANDICGKAVQILGGYGIMSAYHVEKLYRDIKICQIYDGTSQIQREIIVRDLMHSMKQENQ